MCAQRPHTVHSAAFITVVHIGRDAMEATDDLPTTDETTDDEQTAHKARADGGTRFHAPGAGTQPTETPNALDAETAVDRALSWFFGTMCLAVMATALTGSRTFMSVGVVGAVCAFVTVSLRTGRTEGAA